MKTKTSTKKGSSKSKAKKTTTTKAVKANSTTTVDRVLHKDHKPLSFDGQKLPKNRVVLAVIEKYVAKHPNITAAQLKEVFPSSLHPAGIIQPISTAKKLSKKRNRFFFDRPIKLKDKQIVVCSQFGTNNMTPFLEQSKKLGFTVSRVAK